MAPERQLQYSLNFPKSSTPSTTTTSSYKSDCSSCGGLGLSIVGLPAPRSRTAINNAVKNSQRTLKSAPIKTAPKAKPLTDKRGGTRPWTSNKRKVLKNAWSFDSEDSEICSGAEQQKVQIAAENKKSAASCRNASYLSATISECSLSASSAGDVSSLGADDSNSSQYSHARVQSRKEINPPPKNKYSHPISGQSLQKKLQHTLQMEHSNDEEFYFQENITLEKDFERCQIVESSLANVQEKVLELVENQQACSRQTWLVMQQLSATLDSLSQQSFKSEQNKSLEFLSNKPLPEPLLLKEAAGCALRLADILSLIGTSCAPQKQAMVVLEAAVERKFPASPADLQTQKGRLKPVPTELPPQGAGAGLMDELNATLRLRRASIYQSDPDLVSTASEEWTDQP